MFPRLRLHKIGRILIFLFVFATIKSMHFILQDHRFQAITSILSGQVFLNDHNNNNNITNLHRKASLFIPRTLLLNHNELKLDYNLNHKEQSRYSIKVTDSKTKSKIDTIRRYLNESSSKEERLPAFEVGRYLMVDPNRCRDVDQVDLVILVHSAMIHFRERQRIRTTFAKESSFLPFQIRIAFLLGKSNVSTYDNVLKFEHSHYNDTVIGDFVDSYYNLTLKGVMGYRWVMDYCSNSKIVMKIDDDVLVNMYKFLHYYYYQLKRKTKSIVCRLSLNNSMKIERRGKWALDNITFYNMVGYPFSYCSGFLVVITTDLIKSLYEAAKITPFFWIDDIYLFGMLPYVVGNITFYRYWRHQHLAYTEEEAYNCTMQAKQNCSIFAIITRSTNGFWFYWWRFVEMFIPSRLKPGDIIAD